MKRYLLLQKFPRGNKNTKTSLRIANFLGKIQNQGNEYE